MVDTIELAAHQDQQPDCLTISLRPDLHPVCYCAYAVSPNPTKTKSRHKLSTFKPCSHLATLAPYHLFSKAPVMLIALTINTFSQTTRTL